MIGLGRQVWGWRVHQSGRFGYGEDGSAPMATRLQLGLRRGSAIQCLIDVSHLASGVDIERTFVRDAIR